MRYFYYLLLSALLYGSCGNGGNTAESSENSDTLSDSTAASASGRQTDNFFVVDENSNIFVGNSVDNLDITDVNGYDCTISPDGKNIAYTNYVGEHRCIALYDIKKKNNKILNFPVDNEVYMGSFSPDGNYLAVNYMAGSNWTIALYDLKKDTFNVFLKYNDKDYFSPTFSPNGKKFLYHDMENVYINDFRDGKVAPRQIISCDNFCQLNDMGISSATKFQMTDDEKYIYYDFDSYAGRRSELSALASYRMEDGEVKYLTDKTRNNVCDFHISSDGVVYMLMMKRLKNEVANLYEFRGSEDKPVMVSDKNFQTPCSFCTAY